MRRLAAAVVLLAGCEPVPTIHCYVTNDAGTAVCRRIEQSARPLVPPPAGRTNTVNLGVYCRESLRGVVTDGCDAGAFGECFHQEAFTHEYDRFHTLNVDRARNQCGQIRGQWIPDRD